MADISRRTLLSRALLGSALAGGALLGLMLVFVGLSARTRPDVPPDHQPDTLPGTPTDVGAAG